RGPPGSLRAPAGSVHRDRAHRGGLARDEPGEAAARGTGRAHDGGRAGMSVTPPPPADRPIAGWWAIVKGLGTVFKQTFRADNTEQYPKEIAAPPLDNVVFWVFAPISVASAIGMLLVRNAVHAALFLIVNFFCLAVFYLLLDAPFLFAVQIVVYAGAIMVLFLFVIMLLGVDS